MSKRNEDVRAISAFEEESGESSTGMFARRTTWMIVAIALVSVLTLGVFASGRALVISPQGEIFMGNITTDAAGFLFGKGGVITPIYENLTKIQ